MTVKDAAQAAQIDPSTVRRAILSGKLAAVKPGGEWQIRPAPFAAWLWGEHLTGDPAEKTAWVKNRLTSGDLAPEAIDAFKAILDTF